MKTKTRIVFICGIAAFFLLTLLAGGVIYFYTHPSAVKTLVEKSVSRSTGTSFTIKSLSYSLVPLKVRAKGITCKTGNGLGGFYFEVPDLTADLLLEGPLGHKRLIVKSLRVDSFSCRIFEDSTFPKIKQEPQTPSFFGSVLKRMISFFLFRDFRFRGAALSGGKISAQLRDQTVHVREIHGRLNAEHLIELSCAIQIEWPAKQMNLTVPLFTLKTDDAISLVDPQIGGSLTVGNATFESPEANIRGIKGRADLLYQHRQKKLTFNHTNLIFKEIEVQKGAETRTIPLGLRLKTEGAVNLMDSRINAHHLHLSMNDVFQLDGKMDAVFGTKRDLRLKILGGHVLPEKLLPLLPRGMRKTLFPAELSGPIKLAGTIGGFEEQDKWRWDCNLQARFIQNEFSYTAQKLNFSGRIDGDIQAEGRFPDLKISALMKANHAVLSGTGFEVEPSEVSLSFSGKHPSYVIRDLSVSLPSARGVLGKREITVDEIKLRIKKGRVNGASGALFFPEIQVNSSLVKNLVVSLQVESGKISVEGKGRQTGLIKSALNLNLLPSGWEFAGLDSVQIRAESSKEGEWAFTSAVAFQDLGFQNQDSSCMGEKISLRAEINGKIVPPAFTVDATTSIKVDGGEILYDRFYSDLKNNPFFSFCEGKYDATDRHLQLTSLRLGLRDILTLQMQGSLFEQDPARRFDFSVNIPKMPLKPVFTHLVLEPFKTEKPALGTLNIGGTVSANLELTGAGSHWMAKGHLMWHDGELSSEDNGISFSGVDLSLPFWYQNRKGNSPLKRLNGELSIRSMDLSLLPKQSLTLSLDAVPNLLSASSPTLLEVPGGEVQMGPVVVRELPGFSPSVDTSLTINTVQIEPLLAGVWTHPVQGTLSGKLDRIHLEGGNLRSVGEVKAKVFDGEIILSDLGASGLFTATPVFKLNARWKDLNLAEITTGTSFGKIEGILNGYLKDLEISHGQPQRFDLLLETAKKKGVPQKISVKAVDNIAQLGGGQTPFMGVAGLFASLFKEFPYKKIGAHAILENDVFKINGTIKEGGKEYLVKRGLFSGVDVVNQNPDNRVSFKDMIKRIKRVTASKGGPIIN
ncbi:MAG: hypothetical protein HQ561_06350 [Desulfobacteraceae bacterium]|nr:hypothetical protein [Desulfobacteraceae bacterium]